MRRECCRLTRTYPIAPGQLTHPEFHHLPEMHQRRTSLPGRSQLEMLEIPSSPIQTPLNNLSIRELRQDRHRAHLQVRLKRNRERVELADHHSYHSTIDL